MARTKTQETTQRLRSMQRKGVANRTRYELEHNLELFEQHTGKKVINKLESDLFSLRTPRNLSPSERNTLDLILDSFLNDPLSTLEGITQAFKGVPSGLKEDGKEYSLGERASLIDKADRIRKEHAIKDMYASTVLQNIWAQADVNDWNTTDVLNAMMGVGTLYANNEEEKSQFNEEYSSLSFLLGENEKELPFNLLTQKQARKGGLLEGAKIEGQIVDYLLEVLEGKK